MPARRYAVSPQGGGALAITSLPSWPAGLQGTAYSFQLTAAGGNPPYTFAQVGGSLNGLSLNANTGLVSGTPTNAETDNPVFTATDSTLVVSAPQTCSVTFASSYIPVTMATSFLPFATVGVPYNFIMTTTVGTGTAPFTWALNNPAALPVGLTFTNGVFSGTPTVVGSPVLNIQVTDAHPTTAGPQAFSLTVSAASVAIQLKFAPGYHALETGFYSDSDVNWQGWVNRLVTNQVYALNPAGTGYMPSITFGLRWSQLEDFSQATILNNPAAITTQYPGFQRIINIFNYAQSKFPATGCYCSFNFGFNNFNDRPTLAQLGGANFATFYIPKYLANCGGTLQVPNSYGSALKTTYTNIAKPYASTNASYGFAVMSWSGTTFWNSVGPAFWEPAVPAIIRNLFQAFSQLSWTVPASSGPLSNQVVTPDTCDFIHACGTLDEDTQVFTGSGDPVNPPSSGNAGNAPTAVNYHTGISNIVNSFRAALPSTPWIVNESFGFNNESHVNCTAVINDQFGRPAGYPPGLSAIRGCIYSQADTWQSDFITPVQASQMKLGYLGIASGTSVTPVTPTAQSQQGKMGFAAIWEQTDYSNAHAGTFNNVAASVTALIDASLGKQLSNFGTKPLSQWIFPCTTDNTFNTATWAGYIQSTITSDGRKPSELLPQSFMVAPTLNSATVNVQAVTVSFAPFAKWIGRNLTYNILRDGSVVGQSANGNYVDNAVPVGSHSYTVQMSNANGVGPVSNAKVAQVGALRPAYNTGTGLFVLNGTLYDSAGIAFRMRGADRNHWDSGSSPAGFTLAKVNAVREFIDMSISVATQTSRYLSDYKNRHIVAIATQNTDPTNTNIKTTGSASTTVLQNVVNAWVAQCPVASGWNTLNNCICINVANEWGPVGTAWRDAYGARVIGDTGGANNGAGATGSTGPVQAGMTTGAIAQLRTAGFTGPIVIDSGNFGQDESNFTNYASAVFNSDPQKNVIFSYHIYGLTNPYTDTIKSIAKGNPTVVTLNSNASSHPFAPGGVGGLPWYDAGAHNNTFSGITKYNVSGALGMLSANGAFAAPQNIGGTGPGNWTVTLSVDSTAWAGAYTANSATIVDWNGNVTLKTARLAAQAVSTGASFIIGEFGPGEPIISIDPSPTHCKALDVTNACEAAGIGWLAWAWDDHAAVDNSPAPGYNGFGMTFGNQGLYAQTSDLTTFGVDIVLNATTGTSVIAKYQTVF